MKLETKDAARVLKLSVERVRQLERNGTLPAEKTLSGTRLFDAADVKQLAKERAAMKKDK